MLSGSSLKSSGKEEEEMMNNTDIYLIMHEELERKGKGSSVVDWVGFTPQLVAQLIPKEYERKNNKSKVLVVFYQYPQHNRKTLYSVTWNRTNLKEKKIWSEEDKMRLTVSSDASMLIKGSKCHTTIKLHIGGAGD